MESLGRRAYAPQDLCPPQACEFSYWYEGHRSFCDNIPGYAQGAYFPGDEPGYRCRLTLESCDEENCPLQAEENCPLQAEEEHHEK